MDEFMFGDLVGVLMRQFDAVVEGGVLPENAQIVVRPIFTWPDGKPRRMGHGQLAESRASGQPVAAHYRVGRSNVLRTGSHATPRLHGVRTGSAPTGSMRRATPGRDTVSPSRQHDGSGCDDAVGLVPWAAVRGRVQWVD